MALQIITASERLANRQGIKGQIWGRYGIGKTSLLYTLDETTTLAIDLEAGMLSVQDWGGRSVAVRTWEDARDMACLICGPNPALPPEAPYSTAHYEHVKHLYADMKLDDVRTVFIDSTTNAGRYALQWAKMQPAAFSEKTGKPDMRGAYGLLGQELVAWANQWQHARALNVWLVGGLEEKSDDFNRRIWTPLIDGAKAANELPYIVDEVLTMAEIPAEGGSFRALVCQSPNPYGYPAKDRSGRLDQIEEPHLGKLMAKINGPVKPAAERLTTEIKQTETEKEA
jgi:hypothetical protein